MSSQSAPTSLPSSDHTSDYRALHSRVNTNTEVLKSRYEGIMELLPLTVLKTSAEDHSTANKEPAKKGKTMGASDAFAVETHASAMVRAAEDLLVLTRTLKEAWLFGQIGSGFGKAGAEGTDEDAKVTGEILKEVGAGLALRK